MGAELPAHLATLGDGIDGANQAGALACGQLLAHQAHEAAANNCHAVLGGDAKTIGSMHATGNGLTECEHWVNP